MRILHSSDWHLGLHLGRLGLRDDHDHFMRWLLGALTTHAVDVLVIAGDVFDTSQPSAEAQGQYYRFLAQVGATGVQQVVVVGGNHDSPSRLDAPADVLSALSVHVVGGIDNAEDALRRCLVPLRGRSGTVEAVCVALPYVHEFRLGVRTTGVDAEDVRSSFTECFRSLYSTLCDHAQLRCPGLPLVGTGHMTLGVARTDHAPLAIHQVGSMPVIGSIEGLDVSVVDPRLQYLALGHIHASYPLAGRRAWYSGTPVATSFTESTPRRVLLVDIDPDPAGQASVQSLVVPTPRAFVTVEGELEDVCAAIKALKWTEPLPPALSARVRLDGSVIDVQGKINAALASFPDGRRPVLARLDAQIAAVSSVDTPSPDTPLLAELSPDDVLLRLAKERGVSDATAQLRAFGTLRTASDDDWKAMLAAAEGGAL